MRRLAIHLAFWTSIVLTPFALAGQIKPHQIDENFQFELYNTDIFSWATGGRKGPILDTRGRMASALFRFLDGAERNVDLAAYGVQDQNWIFATLSDLTNHKVRIRAVVDQADGEFGEWVAKNFTYPDTVHLPAVLPTGAVLPDVDAKGRPRASTIMHNKFVVVDRKAVWLGSTNFSATCMGGEYNANTSIIVHSAEISQIYSNEFKQMHSSRRFSRAKQSRADHSPFRFKDGTEVEVFFSPQDHPIQDAVIPFIENARTSLDIAMFYLTHKNVKTALLAAQRRGVHIRLLYDALAAGHPSTMHHELRRSGVDVRVENWGGKMHMKSAIADGRHVLTGSMNWSSAGSDANDENTMVIRDNPRLAHELGRYFEQLWTSLDSTAEFEARDPRAESRDSINSCFDGIDNDHDGMVDQADSGC